jgi:hypothetical protein
MEIASVRAHNIMSDEFFIIFQFDKITLIYDYGKVIKYVN